MKKRPRMPGNPNLFWGVGPEKDSLWKRNLSRDWIKKSLGRGNRVQWPKVRENGMCSRNWLCSEIRLERARGKAGEGTNVRARRALSLRATGSTAFLFLLWTPLPGEHRLEGSRVDCRWGWFLISISRINFRPMFLIQGCCGTSGPFGNVWK